MAYTQKFYTADTHFGHALMLSETACARPFVTTREMDEFLIDGWNAAVRPDDVVYHLGDFAFGLRDEARVRSVFRRLNGRKVLILGNHDYDQQNRVHPVIAGLGWEDVPESLRTADVAGSAQRGLPLFRSLARQAARLRSESRRGR